MPSIYNISAIQCTYHGQFGQSDTLPRKASDSSHHLASVKVHWRDLEAAHSSCDRKFDSHTLWLGRGWAVGVGGGEALLAYLRMNLVEARDLVMVTWVSEGFLHSAWRQEVACRPHDEGEGHFFPACIFVFCLPAQWISNIDKQCRFCLSVLSPETLQKYSFVFTRSRQYT